jgi:HlyD family secretion protein
MKTKYLFATTISIISISLVLTACQPQATTTTPTPTVKAVDTSALKPEKPGALIFEGEAVPVNNVTLAFPVNGVVDEVAVKEGDTVKQADVLARLKGSEKQKAAISSAESELLSAQKALDDLNSNANVARAQAQLAMANAKKALDKAVENRNYKNYKRADQWYIDQSNADYILALNDFNNAKTVWESWQDKDDTDKNRAFALQNFAAARKKVEQAEANYKYLLGSPAEVDVQIAEGELVVAKANYEKAQKDWELVKNGPNKNELDLAQERVDNAQTQLDAAKSGLDDLELKSTITGTVVSSNLKAGQISSIGSSSIVVADLSEFQIESNDLTELNISKIHEGDTARITFDGVPGLSLPGKVERIKPLGEDNQGDIVYTVIISLEKQDPRIKWRMTSSIEIDKPE